MQFLDGLLAKQVQGKRQAQQLLALVAHYPRDAVRAAFGRAVRFGAYSLAAIRRILAAPAKPKPQPRKPIQAPGLQDVAERLSDTFDTRVKVELGRRKGRIVVEFGSIDDLERIVELMSTNRPKPAPKRP